MAVYKRSYKPYAGPLTSERSRFLVLPRYILSGLFDSKFLTAFFVVCFIPFLIAAAIIYIQHNAVVQGMMGIREGGVLAIDNRFFFWVLRIQSVLAFLLTAWVGPGLVSPDLANNALPLYFSRPLSRAGYVLGKAAPLVVLTSCITWIPDLILFAIQASLEGWSWAWSNLRIAWAIFAGSMIWIAILALLALAMSAWVKWRIAATGLMAAIFFLAAGFGEAVNAILRTYWGRLINLPYMMSIVWYGLFDIPVASRTSRRFVGDTMRNDIPLGWAWAGLIVLCLVCLLMLNKRLRAREVVR